MGTEVMRLAMPFEIVTFEFLPTYYPSQEEISNPRLYALNVQKLMADKLNISVSDYSHAERITVTEATHKRRWHHRTGLLGVDAIATETGIGRDVIVKKIFKDFLNISELTRNKPMIDYSFCSDFEIEPIIDYELIQKFYNVDLTSKSYYVSTAKFDSRKFCTLYANLLKSRIESDPNFTGNPFLN